MNIEVFKESHRIYLDYNATTPLVTFLKDDIIQWLQVLGNPSSTHQTAQKARSLIWDARVQVARLIHCHPLEIIFTSGGSESNNHAIKGLCEKFLHSKKNKIITSSVEHPSVSQAMDWAHKQGFQVEVIPVSREGILDIETYKKALDNSTAFVSIMYVNNETGSIFPIKEMAHLSSQKQIPFHCDAVQALGKIPLDVKDLRVDLATFSAHKFYSLKGLGVLYCRKGLALDNLIHGGPQERKRRAGTENLLSICALGAVAKRGEEILKERKNIKALRDQLEEDIKKAIPDVHFIGKNSPRVDHSSSIWLKNVFGETVMMNLDLKGYSVSVSSACSSGSLSPSAVLLGMGYTPEEAQCVLRVSLGLGVDAVSLKKFVASLKQVVERLKSMGAVT